jgi:hypothetical protein
MCCTDYGDVNYFLKSTVFNTDLAQLNNVIVLIKLRTDTYIYIYLFMYERHVAIILGNLELYYEPAIITFVI